MFLSHFADLALMTMAHLKPEFFENLRPTMEFFQKWKDFQPWGPECLPIYEWEDLLYVAVAAEDQIPKNSNEKVIYCQTDKEILLSLWSEWNTSAEETASSESEGAPEGFLMDLKMEKARPLSSEEMSIESLFEPTVVASKPQTAPAEASPPIASQSPDNLAPAFAFDFEKCFKELNYHFEKAILLVSSGTEAKAVKWSSKIHPTELTKDSSYSLETPSFLRIAAKTGKSYHGYVVQSEFTEKFFEDWNESKIPDHLTVAPVEVDGRIVGLLVSIGEKSADNQLSLQLAEKVALDLGQAFSHNPEIIKNMAA